MKVGSNLIKVILLLQVRSHDFEPTFIILDLIGRAFPHQTSLTSNKHLSLLHFCNCLNDVNPYFFLQQQLVPRENLSNSRAAETYLNMVRTGLFEMDLLAPSQPLFGYLAINILDCNILGLNIVDCK